MNDDLPDILKHISPPPAPPALRARVLSAVERELTKRRKPRWERALELAAAACLLLGVGLNLWNWRANERWQARVYGPSAADASLNDFERAVASVTDAETARALVARYSANHVRGRNSPEFFSHRYQQVLEELSNSNPGSRS